MTAQHVALISAKTGYAIEKLISRLLRDWKLKGLLFTFFNKDVRIIIPEVLVIITVELLVSQN